MSLVLSTMNFISRPFIMSSTRVYCIKSELPSSVVIKALADFVNFKLVHPSPPAIAAELASVKNSITPVADFFTAARNRLYPECINGSKVGNANRASDKLQEVDEAVGLFPKSNANLSFLDLCGGPGGFSDFILKKIPSASGIGMTLKDAIDWLPDLVNSNRFEIFWGPGNDGNIYNRQNRKALADCCRTLRCNLVVADGGFKVNDENLQEAITARLLLCELLVALTCLEKHGNFCCKLFDSFTPVISGLIFVVARCFRDCFIVKPKTSRITNSERYIVGKGFKGYGEELEILVRILEMGDDWFASEMVTHRHEEASLASAVASIELFPSKGLLKMDKRFSMDLEISTIDLAERQTEALKEVLEEAKRSQMRSKRKRMG